MGAKNEGEKRQRFWSDVSVLIIEEISMVAAPLYNMLDYRAMLGRSQRHEVYATHGDPCIVEVIV